MGRKIAVCIVVMILSIPLTISAAEKQESKKKALKTDSEKLSYAFGMDVGMALEKLPTEIDIDFFIEGVLDTFKEKDTLLTAEQANEVRQAHFKKEQEKQAMEREAIAKKNIEEGKNFLEKNKKKKGVVTTESGLQYIIVKESDGPKPKETDKVKVHYRGTLIDGTEFDSSYKRNEPAVFPVNAVISGWTEALQLMKVGSKYTLFIPANLAYGERGAGQMIGQNATLVFEVELLGIEE